MMQNPGAGEVARLTTNFLNEREAEAMYLSLAAAEKHAARAEVFRKLAAVEGRHAARWQEMLNAAGVALPRTRLGPRVRLIAWLARRVGVDAVLPLVRGMELRSADDYAGQPDASDLVQDERANARTLTALTKGNAPAGVPTAPPGEAEDDVSGTILVREHWHRRDQGGALRAAVFGVNDGLVSNLSLVIGVAGAGPEPRFILLAGIAGLLAGSFSMASGEYVSVSAQREMFERQIALERQELADAPEEEREEIALLYQAKGIPKAQAEQMARKLLTDPEAALDTLAREELGLDPASLGSPWIAAGSSLAAFAAGAVLPVLPYIFLSGALAFVLSCLLSALGLLAVGAAVTLFTGRNPLFGAFRMLTIGAIAASVTYAVGRLIGVGVTG